MNFSVRASGTVMLSVFSVISAINAQAAGQSPPLAITHEVSVSPSLSPHLRFAPGTTTRATDAGASSKAPRGPLMTHPDIGGMTASLTPPLSTRGIADAGRNADQSSNQDARVIPAVSTRFLEGDTLREPGAVAMNKADPAVGDVNDSLASEESHVDSLLLSLALAGLIIMQLRRKQKTLSQRPLGSLSLVSGSAASR